ncbi:Spo0B domain-containing protein [Gracilibacillus marinus]|uniref:Spo0B domain-containing protein n=1 Tax=Gracilibacillus marinus TaxID=630535 RepID=A0ABV8VZW8_9BACI
MNEKDAVELLRHYRHDYLNDLQLVMGYLQLGKQEKAEKKLIDIVEKSNMERKLDQLQIPKTTVFLHQTNMNSTQLKISTMVLFQADIHEIDTQLKSNLEEMLIDLTNFLVEYEEYQLKLSFVANHANHVVLELLIEGHLNNEKTFIEKYMQKSYIHSIKKQTDKQLVIEWIELKK